MGTTAGILNVKYTTDSIGVKRNRPEKKHQTTLRPCGYQQGVYRQNQSPSTGSGPGDTLLNSLCCHPACPPQRRRLPAQASPLSKLDLYRLPQNVCNRKWNAGRGRSPVAAGRFYYTREPAPLARYNTLITDLPRWRDRQYYATFRAAAFPGRREREFIPVPGGLGRPPGGQEGEVAL